MHNLTIVSEDPVAADIVGAEILDRKHVFHLSKALERKLVRTGIFTSYLLMDNDNYLYSIERRKK